MLEMILSALINLVFTGVGMLFGWLISLLNERRLRKRRYLDRFIEFVAAELGEASRIGESDDNFVLPFHDASVRRLEGMAGYIENCHKKEWAQIQPAWEEYRTLIGFPAGVDSRAGISDKAPSKGTLVTRSVILNALRKLMQAANQ